MRVSTVAVVLALAAATTACATRDRPYRFGSPMLGMASTPPPELMAPPEPSPGVPEHTRTRGPALANRQAAPIRVASAPTIRVASAAAAAAITAEPAAQPDARAALPTPNTIASDVPLPAIHAALDLRTLVGRRDKRDPLLAALVWAHDLGRSPEGFAGATGHELVTWADVSQRLAEPSTAATPGDLLVFNQVATDALDEMVGIVITRDDRGVTEFLYLGGGVVRRGFVDPSRPTLRRDKQLRVVNTFLRHGKRWPTKGTHYLAAELLAHVIKLH